MVKWREFWWMIRPPQARRWGSQAFVTVKAYEESRDKVVAIMRESAATAAFGRGYMPVTIDVEESYDASLRAHEIRVYCEGTRVGNKALRMMGIAALRQEFLTSH